jgi:hypothetical protein
MRGFDLVEEVDDAVALLDVASSRIEEQVEELAAACSSSDVALAAARTGASAATITEAQPANLESVVMCVAGRVASGLSSVIGH